MDLLGGNTTKRAGWQTGGKMHVIDAWRERADDVLGKSLGFAHFLPEEMPDEFVADLRDFCKEPTDSRQAQECVALVDSEV